VYRSPLFISVGQSAKALKFSAREIVGGHMKVID